MTTHTFTLDSGEVIHLPTPSLSYTQISMYLKCPAQYEYRYVNGFKTPPAVSLVEGSSAHKAVEVNNLHKIRHGEDLPVKQVVECFHDEFTTRSPEIEDWSDGGQIITPDVVHDRGPKYLGAYMGKFAPEIAPLSSEREWNVLVAGGIPFISYVDLETESHTWDYKTVTSRSPYLRATPESSLQLAIYARLTGRTYAGYIAFLKDKGEVRTIEGRAPANTWIHAEETILRVARGISAGVFPLTAPDNWACSEKFCGYWDRCRGAMLAGTWPAPASSKPKVEIAVSIPEAKPKRKAPPRRKKV